jgi:hypothetical protein
MWDLAKISDQQSGERSKYVDSSKEMSVHTTKWLNEHVLRIIVIAKKSDLCSFARLWELPATPTWTTAGYVDVESVADIR